MKSLILFCLGLYGIYYFSHSLLPKRASTSINTVDTLVTLKNASALSVVFYQDVSGSIRQNGVELVNSAQFAPYFESIDRSIELHFGVIDNVSAGRLVSLTLPAKNFTSPVLQDLRKLSITEKREEKERFLLADKEYKLDSIRFYEDRIQRISKFCSGVDSVLAPYRNSLSGKTDLITAVEVADRALAFSIFGNTKNYLLLNSDGHDSFGRHALKFDHAAEVILINAGAKRPTSVEDIMSLRFQSAEQAIQFTLRNK